MTPSPPPYPAIPKKANNTFQVKETADGEWVVQETDYVQNNDWDGLYFPIIFFWQSHIINDELKLWNDKNT